MESPVVIDKPPEYHGSARDNERGFPFDEEEGSGAWSSLAARHPDIAARLRQRPATWARKRRPSSQDATDDFGESFSGFDRFPFDDIPPEFREHFPSHWNRRFSERDEPERTPAAHAAPSAPAPAAAPHPSSPQPQQQPQPQPQQHSAATQTDHAPEPAQPPHLPQYGLRNTVDLGQRSPADPSLVDADDRTHRSMSAPPDGCALNRSPSRMSAQNHQEHAEQPHAPSNVRHIPIFVEGRDEPVINRSVDHGSHFADAKPPPPPPHADREFYDDGPAFHPPPNFSRAFGTPFNKGFRQGPQPFVQQKVYPQTAFARGASPQRSQSPKPPSPPRDEHARPAHHEHRAEPQPRPQQRPAQQQQPPPQPQPQPEPQEKPPQPAANDPISQILGIQTDVLNLMSEVENFTGTKKDKKYLFLDEMLTRNLIKLDNIETEGKENIRQARKEAIKCIQKCIAVLEAKADKGGAAPAQDVDMQEAAAPGDVDASEAPANGDVDASEAPAQDERPAEAAPAPQDSAASAEPAAADTRPADPAPAQPGDQPTDTTASPQKAGKNVKKRDKSKDNKDKDTKDSNKEETGAGEAAAAAAPAAPMEVDGAASQ